MEDAELVEFFRDKSMKKKAVARILRTLFAQVRLLPEISRQFGRRKRCFSGRLREFYKAAKDGQISGNPGAYLMVR